MKYALSLHRRHPVDDKNPPDQGEPALPVTHDEWGLPVPAPPSWLPPTGSGDDMGYCVGDDPEDRWEP